MTAKLDPETKRLHKLSPAALADEIGGLEARIDALKAEAIRRELLHAEGEAWRITLTPPGTSQRSDKRLVLKALGIDEDEFTKRFCRPVHIGWRLTCTALRKFAAAA